MKAYVVIELFLGKVAVEVKGVYKDKDSAESAKSACRFAFIQELNLIELQSEKELKDVYIVLEPFVFKVPRVVGVFKNKEIAIETVTKSSIGVEILEGKIV